MTNKIDWIDNLRAVACIMVVMIHSTTYYVTRGAQVGELNWDIANVLNSASRACVPYFYDLRLSILWRKKCSEKTLYAYWTVSAVL